jgi:hypothetical protein
MSSVKETHSCAMIFSRPEDETMRQLADTPREGLEPLAGAEIVMN